MYEVYARSDRLTREEWLEQRKSGIGGSDAGAIMGVSPYKGAYSVWADKLGLSSEVEDNEAMRLGRDLEDYVARRFAEDKGVRVRREYGMLRSIEHPCMVANIDRRIMGIREGLECKVCTDRYAVRYQNGAFPMEYYCQCLHYMAVTGWDAWNLAVLVVGGGLLTFRWNREEVQDDIDALIAAEESFWATYIEGGKTPVPDALAATSDVLADVWSESDGTAVDSNEEEDELLTQLIGLKAQKKELDEGIRAIENIIKARMEAAERMRSPVALVTWKEQERSSIDEKLLKEKYPMVDVGSVKKKSKSRVFKIKEAS